MHILVACEFSGRVRQAFRHRGFDAWSCDLLPADDGSPYHIQGFVADEARPNYWDVLIAFPPCTHLAASGARWWRGKQEEQHHALRFVEYLWDHFPARHVAVENPVGILSRPEYLGPPTQIIQPWQFGHGETKRTCLWLKNLPPLAPTDIVAGRSNRIHMMPDTKDRWRKRSITYQGIADAMAAQWGTYLKEQYANSTSN